MSHENYTRHNVLQEGGLGESIGRSGEEEGPESLDGAESSAAVRDGAARWLRQWFNLVVQLVLASSLSTRPLVHSLLVWIYCLRDLSSELTTFSDFHNARKSYGLVVNSIGGKNLLCGTYFLRHAHFRYNLLSINLSFTQLLSSILRLPGGLLLIISPDMSLYWENTSRPRKKQIKIHKLTKKK